MSKFNVGDRVIVKLLAWNEIRTLFPEDKRLPEESPVFTIEGTLNFLPSGKRNICHHLFPNEPRGFTIYLLDEELLKAP